VDYCFRTTLYRIEVVLVSGPDAVEAIEVDHQPQAGAALALADDGRTHAVRVHRQRRRATTGGDITN
jgi:hypothetical protein